VGPRTVLEAVKREILSVPEFEPQPSIPYPVTNIASVEDISKERAGKNQQTESFCSICHYDYLINVVFCSAIIYGLHTAPCKTDVWMSRCRFMFQPRSYCSVSPIVESWLRFVSP
jgi:hypothetical protein